MMKSALSSATLALVAHAAVVVGVPSRRGEELVRRDTTSYQPVCYWGSPQSALIRDTIFIDGGQLQPGIETSSGGLSAAQNEGEIRYTFSLSLDTPFQSGPSPANPPTLGNISRTTLTQYDGYMFANDYNFVLYGGLQEFSNAVTGYLSSNQVPVYEEFLQGQTRTWSQGYSTANIQESGVNINVAAGAGVNVRELNTSYYFSGLHSTTWGTIKGPGAVDAPDTANITSHQLISVDMSDQLHFKWANVTASSIARPRVGPGMVYVPVGDKGVLVVVGGVLWPDWMRSGDGLPPNSTQVTESENTAQSFVTSIEVFDIASSTWYLQNTTGDIPPYGLTKHCTTIASSSDGSSHQIYVYGGYNGQSSTVGGVYSGDVYVLSVPSFVWIKVYDDPDLATGRIGSNCLKVLPDQMFVIGGRSSPGSTCLSDGLVKVFNLNNATFQNGYDPAQYNKYQVPSSVYSVIGGNADGGATKTTNQWADSNLQSIFAKSYTSTAPTWYPYASVAATSTGPASTSSTPAAKSGSSVPGYVWPLVGAIIGLVLLVAIGCGIFLYMKKKRAFASSRSDTTYIASDPKNKPNRLHSWLRQVSPDAGSGVQSEHGWNPSSPNPNMSTVSPLSYPATPQHGTSLSGSSYVLPYGGVERHELPNTQVVAELDSRAIGHEKKSSFIEDLRPVPGHAVPGVSAQIHELPNLPVANTRPPLTTNQGSSSFSFLSRSTSRPSIFTPSPQRSNAPSRSPSGPTSARPIVSPAVSGLETPQIISGQVSPDIIHESSGDTPRHSRKISWSRR